MRDRKTQKSAVSAAKRLAVPAVLLCVLAAWTAWGNTALCVSETVVASGGVPKGFSGFRMAFLSDLHDAEFGEDNEKLLETIAGLRPDIIVITGDIVDSRRTDIEAAVRFVECAAKLAPVYYVTGNHEARLSNSAELRAGLVSAGAVVLDDSVVELKRGGDRLTLLGLCDPDFVIEGDLLGEVPAMTEAKLSGLADSAAGYTVLLSHRPELFESYVKCGVDLVLCGHAHGGQFRLPFVGGLFAPGQGMFPKYDAGLYRKGETAMVVSRGLGNSVFPFRLNNRPEVVAVELERA